METYSVILQHKFLCSQMKFVTIAECVDRDDCIEYIMETEPEWQIEEIKLMGGSEMNDKQELYTHTHYIWHRVLLRVIVSAPFVIIKGVADVIANVAEKLYWKLDEMLPVAYHQTKVPFDQLSKGEQEAIQRVAKARGAILSQVCQE